MRWERRSRSWGGSDWLAGHVTAAAAVGDTRDDIMCKSSCPKNLVSLLLPPVPFRWRRVQHLLIVNNGFITIRQSPSTQLTHEVSWPAWNKKFQSVVDPRWDWLSEGKWICGALAVFQIVCISAACPAITITTTGTVKLLREGRSAQKGAGKRWEWFISVRKCQRTRKKKSKKAHLDDRKWFLYINLPMDRFVRWGDNVII